MPSILNITRSSPKDHSTGISLDPDSILSYSSHAKFLTINREFDQVFNPNFTGCNGAARPLQDVVNLGPTLLPQCKDCLPQYTCDRVVELQEKFHYLENVGVFKSPEDLGIIAEYVNPTYLVKKPSGGGRLTAFAEVGQYAKPQPSLMPYMDSTLHQIARWKFVIITDLTSAFYQIPLSNAGINFIQNHPPPGQTPGTRLEGSKNTPPGTIIVYKNPSPGTKQGVKSPTPGT